MMMSLLQKPLSGGTPAMEREPTRLVAAVTGIRLASPPISSRFLVPVACWMEPEFKNRRPLARAWLMRWNSPPAIPRGVPSARPRTM